MRKIVFLLVIIMAGCGNRSGSKRISTIQNNSNSYIINVDTLEKQESIKLSSFFSTIEAIPLETSKSVLLGRINKLIVYNDTLYVLDKMSAKSLFMFNHEGHCLGSIGHIGQGPGEYSRPEDFTIDTKAHLLYLLDSDRQQIHKYDLNTKNYIESISLEVQKQRIFHIQYCSNAIYGDIYFQKKMADTDFMLCRLNKDTGVQEDCWLSAKEYNLGWNELFFTGNGVFYSQPLYSPKFTQLFMNSVMEITDEGIRPFFVLESKNWLKKEELSALDGRPDERYRNLMKSGRIYDISDVYDMDNIISFKYKEGMDTYNVFYNKDSQQAICSWNMNNDLLYREKLKDGVDLNFGFADKDGAYFFVHPLAMNLLLKNISDEMINEDCIAYDKLQMLTEESNPVIFYLRYKRS